MLNTCLKVSRRMPVVLGSRSIRRCMAPMPDTLRLPDSSCTATVPEPTCPVTYIDRIIRYAAKSQDFGACKLKQR